MRLALTDSCACGADCCDLEVAATVAAMSSSQGLLARLSQLEASAAREG